MLGTIPDIRETAIKVTGKLPIVVVITWGEMGKETSKQTNRIISERLQFCE